jgi:asparagine synthase (glutamine-hydrolysing)
MAGVIRHRGPDDAGNFHDGSVGLGFRRLAILDLQSTGHQPMTSEDENLVLVFNGEVYNYVELRRELQGLGHSFRSTGDTEVLLHAYMEWGPGCLERLNGFWAFLIYDRRRHVLFGSRDRFGKKPLYYYRSPPFVFFASEIKSILASGFYRGNVNWEKASAFLLSSSFDQVPEDHRTFFSDIMQVPPGEAFELDSQGRIRRWSYWSLDSLSTPVGHTEDPAQAWAEIFEDSVRLRLRSDVPVGIFLSGGLDSTSILCVLSDLRERCGAAGNLLAFSFQSIEHDESRYIADTVRQTNVDLIDFRPDPREIANKLERMLWYQDEPIHSLAGLITFELSRMAAERGVKVILNGGGPDEYLAGYPSLFQNYWHTLLEQGSRSLACQEIAAFCNGHGGDAETLFQGTRRTRLRSKLGRFSVYRKLAAWNRTRQLRKHPWFTPELLKYVSVQDSGFHDLSLDSQLRRSVESAPLPLYLRMEDRNSMAHSVEARMPFLDYRLVEFAFRLPAHWKMRGPWNKFVLREAMRGRIPESVRTRLDKMGFPVPAKTWFAGALFEPMLDTVSSRDFRERGIYEVEAIKKDMESHRQGTTDVSNQLLGLLQFELWMRHFKTNAVGS